ncbi:MAG: efflux RND transporter periplasmic adaptor subunit [Pirellulales bacterium]
MRNLRSQIISLLVILLVAVGAFGAWTYATKPHSDDPSTSRVRTDEAKKVKVTFGQISAREVERVVEVMGTLHAFENITISSKSAGHVKKLFCDVSDRVEPNADLLQIDSTDYDLSVRQAERSLQVDLSRIGLKTPPPADFDIKQIPTVKQAFSKLNLSQANAERIRSLATSRASSQQDVENSLAELRMSEAEYENQLLVAQAALSTIAMRGEALSIARQEQANTTVRAPLPTQPVTFTNSSAVYAVSGRHVSEGSYVRQGTELFHLVIDSTLRLKVPVPERFVGTVQTGQFVRVHVASSRDPIEGKVTRINPTIDQASRAFEVEIIIDNRDGRLKPGGFAQAEIITATNQRAVVVPWESVVSFAGVTKLFVVDQSIAKEIQVTLGRQGQDWVEIASPDLQPGTVVVTSGQNGLADGIAVEERKLEAKQPNKGDEHSIIHADQATAS